MSRASWPLSRCLIAALCFVGTACGALAPDTPSTSSADLAFRASVVGPEAPRFRIARFAKTDAVEREFGGAKMYALEFSATIAVEEDADYDLSTSQVFVSDPYARFREDDFGSLIRMVAERPKMAFRGDKLELSGQVAFIRKESGWVVDGVVIEEARLNASGRAPGHSPQDFKRQVEERKNRVRDRLREAQELLEQGEYPRALAAADAALAEAPDNKDGIALRQRIDNTMEILGVTR